MGKARTIVECATAEEVGRALYQGYSVTCSEEIAERCGASFHKEGIDAFTRGEIMEAVERPCGDREPPPDSDCNYLLTGVSEDWEGQRPDGRACVH